MVTKYRLFLSALPLSKLDYSGGGDGEFVKELAEDMVERGQVNPVLVTRLEGRYVVHPGKSRCKAAALLGWDSVTCLVYCPDGGSEDGIELRPEETKYFFSEDNFVEYDHRHFAVKKKVT